MDDRTSAASAYDAAGSVIMLPAATRRVAAWNYEVSRLALCAGLATGCLLGASSLNHAAAAMTKEACNALSAEEFVRAVDDGLCAFDLLPAAGPPALLADNSGTTGEQSDGQGDGSEGHGSGSGDGSSGGDGSGGGSGGSGGDNSGGGDAGSVVPAVTTRWWGRGIGWFRR